jgi:ABC-type multidrug transport system ATPase subunit
VRVKGLDVVTDRQAIRRFLGYLPQEFGAWRLHRVREVLDSLARLSGQRDAASRGERVARVLEQVGLTEVASRKVKKLSGGMVRRLGVAQALVHEPDVLIVDEPTVGLDPEERIRFRELMATLAEERTIVLSTHIVADLGSACRDLALLDGGRIVFRGRPEQLVEQARGRVFDVELDPAGAALLDPRYEEVSRVPQGPRVRVRAVSPDARLPDGGTPVTSIGLEEAYLAFMAARGRSVATAGEEMA